MRFQFYTITEGPGGDPEFQPVDAEFEISSTSGEANVKGAIEDAFKRLRERCQHPLLLFSPTIGEPPGVVVAAEEIRSNPRRPRELRWLYSWQTIPI